MMCGQAGGPRRTSALSVSTLGVSTVAAGFEPSHRREVQPERSSVCHQRPQRSRGGRVPWRLAGLNPLRISRFAAVGCALLAVIMTGNAPANAVVAWRPKPPPLSTPWTHLVGPNNALPEYPRPQMARKHWLNLNGVWDYTGRSGQAVLATLPAENEYHERILVPYPTESALSGIQRHDDQMWYRKVFKLPDTWRGRHVLLHFGAVDQIATVWVEDRNESNPFPVGKQRNSPGGLFYTGSSGIWQTVWLEPVRAAHVEKLD